MDAMKSFSTRDAARILDASEDQVRTYARLGEVVPLRGPDGRPEFQFQHLLLLRTTKGLLEAGVPARRVRRIWASLRRQLDEGLPLTSISIYADGDRAVVWDGKAHWRPDSGQFLLNFDADEVAGRAEEESSLESRPVVTLRLVEGGKAAVEQCVPSRGAFSAATEVLDPPSEVSLNAEQWFHLGCELEEKSPVEARQAYLQALELDASYADAHLNLGRLEHEAGELGKAEAHYRDAVRCAPEDPTSHFNLGVLLEDRGRPEEAAHAYRQVISRDPDSADAHYNLGLLLETAGQRSEAMRHLMIARRLYEQGGAE
jgi:tetratricopeptide (TPR) repeat protein